MFKNLNGLSWSSGHAEQLLFSCLGSKVTVYSRKLQWFFLDIIFLDITLPCEWTNHRAGSQLKMSECQTKAGNHDCMYLWMFLTTFVFMSMLKSRCFKLQMSMLFSWEPALWTLMSMERVLMWSQKKHKWKVLSKKPHWCQKKALQFSAINSDFWA